MKSFKTMTNALLLAAGLTSCVGLTARAQTITLNGTTAAATAAQVDGGGLQYACTPYAPASPQNLQTFVFTPGVNNEVIDRWTLLGDGVATTGTTGTTFSFSPTGFGKARVTVGYYFNNGSQQVFCPAGSTTPLLCGGNPVFNPIRTYTTRTYEFFKVFTAAQGGYSVVGPTCLPAVNDNVVYSISSPVVSTAAQALANIGTDTYAWVVKNAAGTTLSSPANYSVADGGTFITIPNATFFNQSNFSVEVRAGKCNAGVTGTSISVVVPPNLNSTITGFSPACLLIGATGTSTFTLNTLANTTYSLGTTIGTLSAPGVAAAANITIPSAGTGSAITVTLNGITATNSGIITITGVGAAGNCFGTQTVVRQVNRQLVTAQNPITPTCVSANATGVVLTMANAPAGATWTVPAGSGWTITSQSGSTATVNTGAASTSVTVTTACGSISQPISVAGAVTGCDYGVFNISNQFQPHQYGVGAVAGNTCATTGNFYTWSLVNPATGLTLETSPRTADTGPASRTYSFTTGPASWPNYTVRVRVENSTSGLCLDILRTALNQTQRAAAGGAATGGTAPKADAKTALDQVLVYPNPSSDILTIELPEAAKGVARVEIVDVLGRVQRELTTTSQWTLVPVAKLPAGTYTVRVALPDGTRTARPVVVSH